MSKWCGDENCLQCADKDPDPYVHLPREDYNALRDERDRLQRLINIYAKAKVVFDEGRLREDHHAWKERYQALVSAEDELKAALTPAGGQQREVK